MEGGERERKGEKRKKGKQADCLKILDRFICSAKSHLKGKLSKVQTITYLYIPSHLRLLLSI